PSLTGLVAQEAALLECYSSPPEGFFDFQSDVGPGQPDIMQVAVSPLRQFAALPNPVAPSLQCDKRALCRVRNDRRHGLRRPGTTRGRSDSPLHRLSFARPNQIATAPVSNAAPDIASEACAPAMNALFPPTSEPNRATPSTLPVCR